MPSITDLFVTKSSFVVRKSRFAVRSDIRFSTLLHPHMGLFENRVQTWWFFIIFPIQLLVCDIKANPGSVTDQLTNWMGYLWRVQLKQPNQQTNHTLSWMSFRGKHVQAPKVPQRFSSGASVSSSSRALWPSWSNSGGEQHGVVTWPGLPSKLSATNSHWRKRVGQKQAVLLATICFISAVNESVQPVVVGTKSFSQLLYMEKLHCIHRQENSSLPGIC